LTKASQDQWPKHQQNFLRYLQGDASATRSVFTELARILKGFYFARTRDQQVSEDLVQAALLKIHLARDRFDPELSLKTWVFTIAGRTLIDHWRGARDEIGFDEGNADNQLLGSDNPLSRIEAGQDLEKALAALKPNDRSVVYLYVVEGFSMAEIAQMQGSSEGAIKVRAHRAYEKMRKVLDA
jgi:RNA polymerase sigma-70 factor (ECF subfamily)